MKIRCYEDLQRIEQMILNEEGAFSPDRETHVKNFIKRRQSMLNRISPFHVDRKKSWSAKHNWIQNRRQLQKGIEQFHNSTKGHKFHRKLNRYNSDRMSGYGRELYGNEVSEGLTKEDFLTALYSLQTHLVIESQYIIPDLETHISTSLLVDTAMDILESATKKVRCNEELDEIETDLINTLCIKYKE